MLNRDELKTVTMAVTAADTQIGSVVPVNMRRFIYRTKFVNTLNGGNLLNIGKRENGAGVTTVIDRIQAAVLNQMEIDPEELHEDSAPLYIVEGPASNFLIVPIGTSTVWAQCSAAGTGFLTLWYVDSPG